MLEARGKPSRSQGGRLHIRQNPLPQRARTGLRPPWLFEARVRRLRGLGLPSRMPARRGILAYMRASSDFN